MLWQRSIAARATCFGCQRLAWTLKRQPLLAVSCVGTAQPEFPHEPVLVAEVLQYFKGLNLKVYVDCTLGAAGHASAIAADHQELKTLVGFDVDPVAHNIASERLKQHGRQDLQFLVVKSNYSQLETMLKKLPGGPLFGQVDGILMDLGVSSMQIDTADRGFSFLQDGPLDMRMDPTASLTAEEVVNTWPEYELGRIIRDYGEEKMWKSVARRIAQAREEQPITTTRQLAAAIGSTIRPPGKSKSSGGKTIHPATRTFQALRIAVNDEIEQLKKAIPQAIHALASGGRLGVISFHSLEDRIIKQEFLRAAGRPDEQEAAVVQRMSFLDTDMPKNQPPAIAKVLTKRPITAQQQELQTNPRSRCAKLRFLEKL